jgi:hypothetical protein
MLFSEGREKMGRWRTKVLHSLILFSAGFATAVYVLAPPPPDGSDDGTPTFASSGWSHVKTENSGFMTQDRAAHMRAGIDKAVSFAEDNAVKVFQAAKLQLDQWRQQHGQ